MSALSCANITLLCSYTFVVYELHLLSCHPVAPLPAGRVSSYVRRDLISPASSFLSERLRRSPPTRLSRVSPRVRHNPISPACLPPQYVSATEKLEQELKALQAGRPELLEAQYAEEVSWRMAASGEGGGRSAGASMM